MGSVKFYVNEKSFTQILSYGRIRRLSWRRKHLTKMEFFTILKCSIKGLCLTTCFILVIWQNMQNTKRSTAIIF